LQLERKFIILHGYRKQSMKAPEKKLPLRCAGCRRYWRKNESCFENNLQRLAGSATPGC
jgi:phage-related protein